jgi:soluble lytic murein transglycosylase-like protein
MNAYRADIVVAAARQSIEPDLIEALIEQESTYDPYAWNPEPRYRYLWNVRTAAPFRVVSAAELAAKFPPADFHAIAGDADQEWWGQQASWGLMQLMGAVAREEGFLGPFLTELCDPQTNLELGCARFASLVRWASRLYTGLASAGQAAIRMSALAAWNGGKGGNAPTSVPLRNKDYALRVLARYDRIRKGSA